MDTHCKVCDEPWDVYGLAHGDVKAWEADMIRIGIGCPACTGKGNKDYKPKEYLTTICTCEECHNETITVNTDEIHYDGTRLVIYDNLGLINIEDDKIKYAKSFDWKLVDGRLMCENCYRENYCKCEDCDKIISQEDSYYINSSSKYVCQCCYEDYSFCECCEEDFPSDEITNFQNKYYCKDCLDETTFECEICEKLTFNDEMFYGPNDEQCCSEHCADKCEVEDDSAEV